jgi:regulation of enolase protein 1 (concanavalin A-like superfamily)
MTRIYGSTYDPDKGADFKPSGDTLRIAVPGEPRLLGPWCKVFNAPRVWREVTGDFTVTVRVSFPIRSKIPPQHEDESVSEVRASGGLVVWTDTENFMTVTRDERKYDGEPGEYFRAETLVEGVAQSFAEYSAPGQSGYLRAQRNGKVLVGRYSLDGKKWTLLHWREGEWGNTVKVGVVAENSFRAPFEAVFDEYALTHEPTKPGAGAAP